MTDDERRTNGRIENKLDKLSRVVATQGELLARVDERTAGMEKAYNLMFESVEQATELARTQMEARLEGMNEFREQLKDQASKFVTREELESKVSLLNAEIKSTSKGKVSWGVAIAITALVSFSLSAIILILTVALK